LTLKQVQAVKSFTHRGAYVAVGDVFLVSPVRAKILEHKGYVTREITATEVIDVTNHSRDLGPLIVEDVEPADELVEVAVPVSRRRSYRRRDMTAETE
jgi:hypothetical protein